MGLVDRDSSSHPRFRTKLEAIGFGFVICAGLLSVLIFPPVALGPLRHGQPEQAIRVRTGRRAPHYLGSPP